MMNIEYLPIVLLVAGFLPCSIKCNTVIRKKRRYAHWKVRAAFWQLTVTITPHGFKNWQLDVLLLSRISSAIWDTVKNMVKSQSDG